MQTIKKLDLISFAGSCAKIGAVLGVVFSIMLFAISIGVIEPEQSTNLIITMSLWSLFTGVLVGFFYGLVFAVIFNALAKRKLIEVKAEFFE